MNRLLFNAQMAQYATPTITGESNVVIENGVRCYLPELKIDGNTTQQICAGKNQFYQNGSIGQSSGVTCTYNEETQEFTLNGTKTANGNVIISRNMKLPKLRADRQYRISRYVTGGSMEWGESLSGARVQMLYSFFKQGSDSVFARIIEIPSGNKPEVYSGVVTFPEDTTEYIVYVQIFGSNTYNNWTFKLMLEEDEGQTVGEYEPYKLLSPDYPTEIINAGDNGDNGIEVEVRGANLIDYTNKRFSLGGNAGATYSLADDILNIEMSCYYMYFQLSNSTADTYTLLQEIISLNDNLDSTLSMTLLYRYTDGTYKEVSKNLELGKNVLSINKGAGKRGDRLEIRFLRKNNNGSSVATASIKNLMVCEGEILEYEPYVEPQIVSIPRRVDVDGETVDLRFAKVGDYADKIIVDGVNKTVTYQQNIHEKIFDGTEDISIPTTSLEAYGLSAFRYLDFWKQAAEVFRCNHLTYNNQFNYRGAKEEGLYGLTTAGQMFFCISTDRIPLNDTEAFKNHLAEKYNAGTPYIVQYASLTPIPHDITDSPLSDQLLALVQNNGTTIIEASNINNLKQTLTTKYLTHV